MLTLLGISSSSLYINLTMLRSLFRFRSFSTKPIRVSEEIQHALKTNKPIVALESTIITHGLPYPANIEMAQDVESIIRSAGCVPATMGYISGEAVVGCSSIDLERLGEPLTHGEAKKMKISRRDIPTVIARKLTGGTTIATTMDLCHRVGIDIFATGGLGGVSRPFDLMDVSADLEELAQTPVGVVCSGPKSILDVGRTLEYLETKGVMVSTFVDDGIIAGLMQKLNLSKAQILQLIKNGETLGVNVPGFYIRESGILSPYVFESANVAANLLFASKYQMDLSAGQVFCVPAPEEVALQKETIQSVIDDSLARAEELGVKGKELTPFLLGRINKVTNGASVRCNIEFVKNNAKMGSEIAKRISQLKGGVTDARQRIIETKSTKAKAKMHQLNSQSHSDTTKQLEKVNTFVVGSVALDTICNLNSSDPVIGDSNPGRINDSSIGGVGFNVFLAAQSINNDNEMLLLSTINFNDSAGKAILEKMKEYGISSEGILSNSDYGTGQYISMHTTEGKLIVACADMSIIEHLTFDDIKPFLEKYEPSQIVVDANINSNLIEKIIKYAEEKKLSVVYEPTSAVKCTKISQISLPVFPQTPIELITPTIEELQNIYTSFAKSNKFDDIEGWFNVLDAIGASSLRETLNFNSHKHPLVKSYLQNGIFQQAFQILPYLPRILIKDGSNGVTVIQISTDIANDSAKRSPNTDWCITSSAGAGRYNLGITIEHYPSLKVPTDAISNVTGAGDCLLGYLISSSQEKILPPFGSIERSQVIENAQRAAIIAITNPQAVPVKQLSNM